jgi:hypothetical protein
MVINIAIYKDDHLLQREINQVAKTLVGEGRNPKTAQSIATKRVSEIQNTQIITTDSKYDKDINPVKIAQDIIGNEKKRFKVTTTKNQ